MTIKTAEASAAWFAASSACCEITKIKLKFVAPQTDITIYHFQYSVTPRQNKFKLGLAETHNFALEQEVTLYDDAPAVQAPYST